MARPSPLPEAARPTPPLDTDRFYIPALDGLRFFAFFQVYLFHQGIPRFAPWLNAAARASSAWFGGAPANLGDRWVANGWAGVQVFFVLSGYLIGSLLCREREILGRVDLRSFWLRRILRIWPLYYATLLLACAVLPLVLHGFWTPFHQDFLRHQSAPFAVFCGNWSMAWMGPPPNDAISVLWSVCVEEQFYLLVPLILAFLNRKTALGAVSVLIVLGVASRWLMITHGAGPLLFSYASTNHLDSLMSGVWLALWMGPKESGERRFSWPIQTIELLLFGGVLTLLASDGLARSSRGHQVWDYVVLWALLLPLLGILTRFSTALGRLLSYSRLVWLGRVSYGLYMLHEIALWISREAFLRSGWFPNKEILEPIAALGLTVGLAAISYYGLERPFLRLKRRWTRVASRPD